MRQGFMAGALAIAVSGIMIAGQQPAAPAQPAQPAQAKPAGPALKSPAEQQALQAVMQAVTPDARITAAEDFITKFPDSDFKAMVLLSEAQSYQQKNDYEKTVIYGERTLDAKPAGPIKAEAMLMLAKTIAQRTREFDLDREEKLGRVEKYANGAIELITAMPKPNPNLPDQQWETAKAQMISDAHEALGMDAQVRKDYDKAISEYKTAVSTFPGSTTAELRLAMAYNKAGKYDDAITLCDKLMADPNTHPTLKGYAQAERARAIQAKNPGQKPAAGATPAPAGGAAPATPAPAPAPSAPKP